MYNVNIIQATLILESIVSVKKYLLLFGAVFALATLTSCSKIECEAYDLSHRSMEWHLFPSLHADYECSAGDSLTINLSQVSYKLDEYEQRWCHVCACMNSGFEVVYSDPKSDINIACSVTNSEPNGTYPGSFTYTINDFMVQLNLTDENEFMADNIYANGEYEFSTQDSISINDVVYKHVVAISIKENNNIKEFWIAKGYGLVGFNYKGVIVSIKE